MGREEKPLAVQTKKINNNRRKIKMAKQEEKKEVKKEVKKDELNEKQIAHLKRMEEAEK